jgi:5-methylcytosine-specific restriction endonuclease McrA
MKKEQRVEVYNKYDGHCSYCGKEIAYEDMQVDHYMPQRLRKFHNRYAHIDFDGIDNLMPTCRRCNHYKRSLLPENFRKQMKTLHERIKKIYICKVALDYDILNIEPFEGTFYFETRDKEKKCIITN